MASSENPFFVPQRISIRKGGHYEVTDHSVLPYEHIAILGHGASAVVEKVRDRNTQRVYARKVFRVLSKRLDVVNELYQREVQIIRRLAPHHHVIRVFATYRIGRELAVILYPVANGGDLASYLASYRDLQTTAPMSVKFERRHVLMNAFGCLAAGLSYLHECSIRHKDIKPQNILIHQGSVIYSDFGIARDYQGDNSTTDGHPGSFTKHYCSPETADHDARNRKSDIFSLGCVYLEILTSLDPNRLGTQLDSGPYYAILDEIHAALENNPIVFTTVFGMEIQDVEITDFVKDMLSKDPEKRPSAADVVHSLKEDRSCSFFCHRCWQLPQPQAFQSSDQPESQPSSSLTSIESQDSFVLPQTPPNSPCSTTDVICVLQSRPRPYPLSAGGKMASILTTEKDPEEVQAQAETSSDPMTMVTIMTPDQQQQLLQPQQQQTQQGQDSKSSSGKRKRAKHPPSKRGSRIEGQRTE